VCFSHEADTGISHTPIAEIVKRIREVTRPQRIIRFGSVATGQMTKDSDTDLLVLASAPLDPRQETIGIRQAVRGLGCPFDIIVMATDRFEETKDVIGCIAYPAHKYGKVIYEEAA